MPEPVSEQILTTGLSDMLFFQQVEVVYALVVLLITVGMMFWLFGSQFHRLIMAVFAFAVGIVAGWHWGHANGVNVFIAMTIGAVIGAALGYWLFRFWLGLFTSGLVCLVLVLLYGYGLAMPHLREAARQSEFELAQRGLTLQPPPTTQPGRQPALLPTSAPAGGKLGLPYRTLQEYLPRLTRAYYDDWNQWRAHFGENLSAVYGSLSRIVPGLKFELTLIIIISLICGMVLAFLRPDFLNVVYTSAIGALMVVLGAAILLMLKTTPQAQWLWANLWVVYIALLLMVLVGVVLQYYLFGLMEEEEAEEEEAEAGPAKAAKSGKSKRK